METRVENFDVKENSEIFLILFFKIIQIEFKIESAASYDLDLI